MDVLVGNKVDESILVFGRQQIDIRAVGGQNLLVALFQQRYLRQACRVVDGDTIA